MNSARRAILLNIPTNAIFLLVQLTAGLVTFAYFEGCDLIKSGLIKKSDQILPYVVMVLFNGVPVVRGLFLSTIFAAALSTVSSGVNSLANVVLEDIIRPFHLLLRKKDLSAKYMTIMAFVLSVLIGLSTVGLAFLIPFMGPRVLQFSFSLFGSTGGPLLAVFTLGMIVPCVNNKGGIAGFLASIIVGLWLSIGAILNPSPSGVLPLSNISCAVGNVSKTVIASVRQTSWSIYSISYLYYTPICLLVALIVSIPVSAIFGELAPVVLVVYGFVVYF
ncbi:solute carrier family 5 (sodium-coupled monocarboxylate transporter), member 8/12 [Paragonimus westermani]|uniref:Solute carrier family 5 (Sodium-coupled monocarboxylate transporter), member 8/12 n=1 Tax=Paragonimus westermani TaxID=34504 RepID=A0A5J4N5S9_9TREM|nr:solute carrier family 5 (sodium-coupled monocarboxylate transporter), member 8/12 [Paragonimus westermani]